MKKILFLLCIVFTLSACGTYQTASPVDQLTSGMSKYDVEYLMGNPSRVMAVNRTPQGIQEVLEYRDPYGDYYALEFWNDYLVNCEYLNYGNPSYVYAPAYAYPTVMPPRGRAVVIVGSDYRPRRKGNSNNYYYNDTRSTSSGRSSSRTDSGRNTSSGRSTSSDRNSSTTNTGRSSSRTDSGRTSTTTGNSRSSSGSTSTSRSSSTSGRSTERTSNSTSRSSSSDNKSSSTSRSSSSDTSNSSGRSSSRSSGR